jgi:plastocyanin
MRERMVRGTLGIALLVMTAIPLASATPASAVVVQRVAIRDNAFKPATVTIAKGTRVRWVNRGTRTHSTTSTKGLWNVTLAPGESFGRRFRKAGTFTYLCVFHSGMTGTIVVT